MNLLQLLNDLPSEIRVASMVSNTFPRQKTHNISCHQNRHQNRCHAVNQVLPQHKSLHQQHAKSKNDRHKAHPKPRLKPHRCPLTRSSLGGGGSLPIPVFKPVLHVEQAATRVHLQRLNPIQKTPRNQSY